MAELTVRLDHDLWLFVSPRRRRPQIVVQHDGTASLGHVIEALGVPLTEVGALRVNGEPVAPSHIPEAGAPETKAVVEVGPVARPQTAPGWTGAFLLDVHLGTLARRLRVLGIDAAYRNDASDEQLIDQARRERRILLTKDRALLKQRALWAGAYVRGAGADTQSADVLDRFAPPLRPWTRCTACNGELLPVPKQEVIEQLESGTRRRYDRFARCQSCRRVYWHGAHGRRLDAIVAAAHRPHVPTQVTAPSPK